MSSEEALSISALEAAFAIAKHQKEYPVIGDASQSARNLMLGPATSAALDFRRGLSLVEEFGLGLFESSDDNQADLRRVLTALILRDRPVWAFGAAKGRRWCRPLIDEDTLQCLRYAGLYAEPASDEAIKWWDRIAGEFRFVGDTSRTLTGRAGEQLTLESERQRLRDIGLPNLHPLWVAVEDNTLGYDVESWDVGPTGDAERIFIEVKAHSTTSARFFVSRNEWLTALDFCNSYRVHIWALPTQTCRVLTTHQLALHIPEDKGSGSWQQVCVVIE